MRCAASMGMPRSAASLGEANGTTKRERWGETPVSRALCKAQGKSREGGRGEEAEEERNAKIDKGDRQR